MAVEYAIRESVLINGDKNLELRTYDLPEALAFNKECSLITAKKMTGHVVFRCADKETHLFEVRGTKTPKGDYLVMFPHGQHYGGGFDHKINEMYAVRSKDNGKTWSDPVVALDIDYNQHGFIPLIPEGSSRIYCFGTQPVWDKFDPTTEHGIRENAPIGYFYSDDDGYTWEGPTLIEPEEDPTFTGMSVMRMCETSKGTWLLGSHNGYYWADMKDKNHRFTLSTYEYILRSEDQGKTWHILPGKRDEGLQFKPYERMDEGRMLSLGGEEVLFMIRTPEGHLWRMYSADDGRTWTDPEPTTLVHPDAPPMVFMMSDGKTLCCFHHNRHHDLDYGGLNGDKEEITRDRNELWVSFSTDKGVTWTAPRFVLANVANPDFGSAFHKFQCSYIDAFADGTTFHIFMPHLWHEVLHLEIEEKDLLNAPTKAEIFNR